jgi:hypothetical protein
MFSQVYWKETMSVQVRVLVKGWSTTTNAHKSTRILNLTVLKSNQSCLPSYKACSRNSCNFNPEYKTQRREATWNEVRGWVPVKGTVLAVHWWTQKTSFRVTRELWRGPGACFWIRLLLTDETCSCCCTSQRFTKPLIFQNFTLYCHWKQR